MAERIDELLVGLGLETDERSFQQGMGAFADIRRAAMSTAGVITAAFSATSVANFASELAGANIEAERLDTTVGRITQLDDAFRMAGASGAEATAELSNMARLLDAFRFQPGGNDFALAQAVGLDPRGIADAEGVMEGYQRLIEQAQNLPAQQRRVALESLGFGEGTTALSIAGADQMQEWMAESARLADRTDEMVQQSIEFNQELQRLNIGIRGLTEAVTAELLPELTALIGTINDWLGEDGRIAETAEIINEGPEALGRRGAEWVRDKIGEWFESRDTPMTRAQGQHSPSVISANGDLFRSTPDRGADTWIPDIWPETLDVIRQMQIGPEDVGGSPAPAMPRDLNAETLEAIRQRQERGEFTPQDREYLREQMRQQFPERYQGNVTINIDGAQDPQAVASAVDMRLRQLTIRTADDYRSPVV